MKSIVLELQRDAIDSRVSIATLLRRALLVAKKLSIHEFQEWIHNELDGYYDGQTIPSYRVVFGELHAFNPYRGWIPILIADSNLAGKVQKREVGQPAIDLEVLLRESPAGDHLQMPFEPELEVLLMKSLSTPFPARVTLFVGRSQLHGIIEAVRNTILNWSLKLEEDGILGENMTFTSEEKKTAASATYYVTNFLGDATNTQIQQGSHLSAQSLEINSDSQALISEFIKVLQSELASLNLPEEQVLEIKAEIATIEAQIASTKPKTSIIGESLSTIRNILEGATGSLVATGLLSQLSNLLG